MNAFTSETLDELEKLIHNIEKNPEIKVMILSTVSDEFFRMVVHVFLLPFFIIWAYALMVAGRVGITKRRA